MSENNNYQIEINDSTTDDEVIEYLNLEEIIDKIKD